MSAHWRLALGGAAATAVMSLGAAAIVGYYFGAVYAGAFLYGAGVGLVSFTSIAITAWLLGGRMSGERVLLGVAVYFGRLVFAVVAVGAPIFLASWPALALIGGFAGANAAAWSWPDTRQSSDAAPRRAAPSNAARAARTRSLP